MNAINASQPLTFQRPQVVGSSPSPAKSREAASSEAGDVEAAQVQPQVEASPTESKVGKAPSAEEMARDLAKMVEEINDNLFRNRDTRLQYSIDSELGSVVVQFVDKRTDEVVRSIPSEEVIALRKRMMELADAKGVFFRQEG